jgi:hypothetical protein
VRQQDQQLLGPQNSVRELGSIDLMCSVHAFAAEGGGGMGAQAKGDRRYRIAASDPAPGLGRTPARKKRATATAARRDAQLLLSRCGMKAKEYARIQFLDITRLSAPAQASTRPLHICREVVAYCLDGATCGQYLDVQAAAWLAVCVDTGHHTRERERYLRRRSPPRA